MARVGPWEDRMEAFRACSLPSTFGPGFGSKCLFPGWRWPGHQGVRWAWSVRWNTQQPAGLKRRVPAEHFPPEVSGAQLVFMKRVGPRSPSSEAFALRGAGPRQPASKGRQNHWLLRGSEAGPQLGGCWESRASS